MSRLLLAMLKTSEHTEIWRLAGPLILSNISIALLGIVDTAVVGHLDSAHYLGAVAVGAVIFDFIYWGMGFLRMGTTGLAAQAHGRVDADELRAVLVHAVGCAIVIALFVLLFQDLIIEIGIALIGGSEQVREYASIYVSWAIWGAPAVLVTMVLIGWLLGMQDARATLITALVINVVNIILDVVFVYGLGLDVRGVALASVLAQYTGLLIVLYLVVRKLKLHPGRWHRERIADTRRLKGLLILNQNIFIRTLCLILVFAFFTRQGARQGEIILAANAVLLNFQLLTALGLDGFANAAEALVGRAIGALDRHKFFRSITLATEWALVIAVLLSAAYFIWGNQLIGLMTSLPEVIEYAQAHLAWVVVLPVLSVWCFLLDGIFIGATRSAEMRNTMLFSSGLIFLPAWYSLQALGNHGLWLAMLLFFIARGLSLGAVFYRIEKYHGGFIRQHQGDKQNQ